SVHKSGTAPGNRLPHRVRIVGGRWRGRKLEFPAIDAIRPSPDRVRETLFNWLQHEIVGTRCLDLFAGSGALGFEALSRGAAHVTFVDREPRIGRYLRETLQRLQCMDAAVVVADALSYLNGQREGWDIVFLDPPFASDLLKKSLALLQTGWLKPNAWVYIECDSTNALSLPPHWSLHRSSRAGQVGYHLIRVTADAASHVISRNL
ncbi:MAG TPA: 16S rRNA (guanine(966)-N(2))-methyltransferase RsmD, partial [Steroidobacteraceae bacterium]|nr:16S rRNA (guanine(966)-N(2))-methyltransferase RsmD [Steroidobacteraceae bacterium]